MAANESDVRFRSPSDGAALSGFAAWSPLLPTLPAVVIVPDVRGLYEFYRDVARRLAREGFFAVALDLYSREGPPDLPDMDSIFSWMRNLPDRRVLADIAAAVGFAAHHERVADGAVGITGFCMGGQYALMAACSDHRIRACVSWYGMLRYDEKTLTRPADPLELAPELGCPYLGLFGADDDLIPAADVEELRAVLDEHHKTFELRSYPGAGHAFFNDTRPDAYRPGAAADAWSRALAFLHRHLGR